MYYFYDKIILGHVVCLLYGGCPYLGESVMGGLSNAYRRAIQSNLDYPNPFGRLQQSKCLDTIVSKKIRITEVFTFLS